MLVKYLYISQRGNKKSLTRNESETELWRCAENFASEFPHTLISAEVVDPTEATNDYWDDED